MDNIPVLVRVGAISAPNTRSIGSEACQEAAQRLSEPVDRFTFSSVLTASGEALSADAVSELSLDELKQKRAVAVVEKRAGPPAWEEQMKQMQMQMQSLQGDVDVGKAAVLQLQAENVGLKKLRAENIGLKKHNKKFVQDIKKMMIENANATEDLNRSIAKLQLANKELTESHEKAMAKQAEHNKEIDQSVDKIRTRNNKMALRCLADQARRQVYGRTLSPLEKANWDSHVDEMHPDELLNKGISKEAMQLTKYGGPMVLRGNQAAHDLDYVEVADVVMQSQFGAEYKALYKFAYGMEAQDVLFNRDLAV